MTMRRWLLMAMSLGMLGACGENDPQPSNACACV